MRRSFLILGLMTTLVFAGQAAAQGKETVIIENQSARFENASAMIGAAVVDQNGDHLGMIEDVVFSNTGEASYLVLSQADQSGEQVVPIPLTIANPQRTVDGDYVIDVNRQTIDSAPAFSRTEVNDLAQNDVWEDEVRGYFGVETARAGSDERLRRYDYGEYDIAQTIESSKEKGQMTNPFDQGNFDKGNFGAGEPRWPSDETRGYFGDESYRGHSSNFDTTIESSKEKGQMTNPFSEGNLDEGNAGAGEPRSHY